MLYRLGIGGGHLRLRYERPVCWLQSCAANPPGNFRTGLRADSSACSRRLVVHRVCFSHRSCRADCAVCAVRHGFVFVLLPGNLPNRPTKSDGAEHYLFGMVACFFIAIFTYPARWQKPSLCFGNFMRRFFGGHRKKARQTGAERAVFIHIINQDAPQNVWRPLIMKRLTDRAK